MYGNDSVNKKEIYIKFNTIGLFHPIHYVATSAEIIWNNKHAFEAELGIINSYTGIPYLNKKKNYTSLRKFPQRIGIRTVVTYKYYFNQNKKKNIKKNRMPYFGTEIMFSYHQLSDDSYLYNQDYQYFQLYKTKSTHSQIGIYTKFGFLRNFGKNKKGYLDGYFGFGYYGISQKIKNTTNFPANINVYDLSSEFIKIERTLSNPIVFRSYFMLDIGLKFGFKLKNKN